MEPRALKPLSITPPGKENEPQERTKTSPKTPCTPLPSKMGNRPPLVTSKTCPPKEMMLYIEAQSNPFLAHNLIASRRKSLQFKPKISSPLGKACFFAE